MPLQRGDGGGAACPHEKLRAAGVKTTHELYKGVTHEFFGMDAVVGNAVKAQDLAARELKTALATGTGRTN